MGLLKAVWSLMPRKRQRHTRLQQHDYLSDHDVPNLASGGGSSNTSNGNGSGDRSRDRHGAEADTTFARSLASSLSAMTPAVLKSTATAKPSPPPRRRARGYPTSSEPVQPLLHPDSRESPRQPNSSGDPGIAALSPEGATSVPASAEHDTAVTLNGAHSRSQGVTLRPTHAAAAAALPASSEPQPDDDDKGDDDETDHLVSSAAAAAAAASMAQGSSHQRKSSSRRKRLGSWRHASSPSSLRAYVGGCLTGLARCLARRSKCSMVTNPDKMTSQSYVNYITVVIFLEFFAWGLVTTILPQTFADFFGPGSKWLVLGLTQGLKGFLSFLSAPVLGALSDSTGRKRFLLLAVGATCLPLPFLLISNLWWHVVVVAISGVFAVTFSIVFAYVSDVTSEEDRSAAFGQVSATFAASLVISPALGSFLQSVYGVRFVFAVSTAIALLDVLFIVFFVPESIPPSEVKKTFSWHSASPFASLKVVFSNVHMLKWSVIVFFSYLPEAGQYQCLMLYLQSVGFSTTDLAAFIAGVGILSIIVQTYVLSTMTHSMSQKSVIVSGLIAQASQLALYGVVTAKWALFMIGGLLAFSSLNYPAVSALLSQSAAADQQGAVQGMVTGIRSLCTGLGPAVFGALFQYTEVPLDQEGRGNRPLASFPGSPFLVGCAFVFVALFVSMGVTDRKRQEGQLYAVTDEHEVINDSFVGPAGDAEEQTEGAMESRTGRTACR